jgi:hypothetical protein
VGGHRRPLGFVVFYYIQLFALFAVFIPLHFIRDGSRGRPGSALVFSLVMAPLACGVFIVLLYLFTGIDHLCLLLLGGKGSFEATLRVVAYSYPTNAVPWTSLRGQIPPSRLVVALSDVRIRGCSSDIEGAGRDRGAPWGWTHLRPDRGGGGALHPSSPRRQAHPWTAWLLSP